MRFQFVLTIVLTSFLRPYYAVIDSDIGIELLLMFSKALALLFQLVYSFGRGSLSAKDYALFGKSCKQNKRPAAIFIVFD